MARVLNLRRAGFTLVEVIAVMIVLAIIGVAVTPKFIDAGTRATQSAEQAVVGAVRTAIRAKMLSNSVAGSPGAPASLDAVAANGSASAGAPMFSAVLAAPVTRDWRKGSTINTYIGPTGTTYYYDPPTGQFDTTIAAVDPTQTGVTTSPSLDLTSATSWTAGGSVQLGAGRYVGTGYSLMNGELMLTSSYGSFSEAARRVLITGQTIAAGNYSLGLDTALSNYWNQLNYWQVYAVRNGTTLNLSGNTLNWGTAPTGTKLLARNYAPDTKSDGSWYSYTDQFTISAQDAADYDQIVVIMAGSKFDGQVLGWRNVNLFQP